MLENNEYVGVNTHKILGIRSNGPKNNIMCNSNEFLFRYLTHSERVWLSYCEAMRKPMRKEQLELQHKSQSTTTVLRSA
jgi:hypothetical protein